MLFSRNTWIFVQFILWIVYCMSYFHLHVFVWMTSCLLVSYDKFLAMRLVNEFFHFSKVESVSTFFSPRPLLSNWYYCVIWCISGEKTPFVRKKSTSGKPALCFESTQFTSSLPEVFLVKRVLEICSKFTGEHPCRSVISIKLQSNLFEITLRHGFSCKVAACFQNTFFQEHLWVSASVNLRWLARLKFSKCDLSKVLVRKYRKKLLLTTIFIENTFFILVTMIISLEKVSCNVLFYALILLFCTKACVILKLRYERLYLLYQQLIINNYNI